MSALANSTPVWLAARHGPAHRAGPGRSAGTTGCRQDLAGMVRTTLIAAAVAQVLWCPRCFPESAMPGWPLTA